jgi:hypothetical protein
MVAGTLELPSIKNTKMLYTNVKKWFGKPQSIPAIVIHYLFIISLKQKNLASLQGFYLKYMYYSGSFILKVSINAVV